MAAYSAFLVVIIERCVVICLNEKLGNRADGYMSNHRYCKYIEKALSSSVAFYAFRDHIMIIKFYLYKSNYTFTYFSKRFLNQFFQFHFEE